MADKSLPVNQLDTPRRAKRQWVALGVSVSPDFKARLEAVARDTGLSPSAYARMVLMREIALVERSEAASKVA